MTRESPVNESEASPATSTPSAIPMRFKNRDKAEEQLCVAIAELGEILGVGEAKGNPHHLSKAAVTAVEEAAFQDLHLIGGPGAFSFAKTDADVDRMEIALVPVADELRRKAGEVNQVKAENAHAIIMGALIWLRSTIKNG